MALSGKGLISLYYTRYFNSSWYTNVAPDNWILIKILDDTSHNVHQSYQLLNDWLINNSVYRWCAVSIHGSVHLYVENIDDAVLLKLIWE